MLCTYILLLPFDRLLPDLINVLILTMVALVAIRVPLSRLSISLSRHQVVGLGAFAAFVGWLGLAAFASAHPIRSLVTSRTYLLYFLVTGSFVAIIDSPKRVRNVFAVIAFVTATVGVLTVINLVAGVPFAKPLGQVRFFGVPRTLGAPMGYGAYGILAAMGGSFAASTAFWPTQLFPDRPVVARIAAGFTLNGIFLGVIIGQSRSTLVGFVVIAGVFLALVAIRSERIRVPRAVVLMVATACAAGLAIRRTIGFSFIGTNPISIEIRLEMFQSGFSSLIANPILGCGWSCTGGTAGGDTLIHNTWLVVGVVAGVPAMALWVLIFLVLFAGSVRHVTSDGYRGIFGVVAVCGLVGGAIELTFFPGIEDVVGVLLGAVASIAGLGQPDYLLRIVGGLKRTTAYG